MFRNIIVSSLAVILLAGIIHGSPISVAQLNAQHSEATVRQTKSFEMRKYLNESADPCEDFYEFTCGNYARYHPTKTTMSELDTLHRALYDKIKHEMDVEDPRDTDVDRKVRSFYRSCISAPQLVGQYKDKLIAATKEFGQMPVLAGDRWQESDFDFSTTVSKMIHKTSLNYIIFGIGVTHDFNDNSINRVALVQAPFALRDISLYEDQKNSGAREQHKRAMARNLHTFLGVEETLALQTAQEIVELEIALAHGLNDNKLGLPLNEIFSVEPIEDVQKKYLPVWDTKQLIGGAMGFTPHELMVQNHYLENTFRVLRHASKRTVANYVFFAYMSALIFEPTETALEREQLCIASTKKIFYENMMNSIYRKYFTEQMKEGVLFMWHELKAAFENTLLSARLNWLKADTRQYAVDKLKAMKLEILSYEHKNFSLEFSELDLNDHDYVHNMNLLLFVLGQRARAKFNEPPEPMVTRSYAPFNVRIENTVKIPIDVLQPFFAWSSAYPYAYNFATLGFYIAHEIIHGFDEDGRHCDTKGNLQDWWDSRSESEFRDHTKCFVDQYKSYTYGGRHLPAMPAQGENIADNGGVRLAYEAYHHWYQKNGGGVKESFPGLNYNNRQLFFISYGQVWCAATHPNYMATQVALDIHVPEKFRVIGPLSNYEEFAKEFNCPKGSGMNPMKKCEIY